MTQPHEQELKASTRDVIERLHRLQDLDRRLQELTRQIDGAPGAVETLAKAVKAAEQRGAALEERTRILRAQVRLRENDAKAILQRIERLNEQARTVATQREFKAISSEVAGARADVKRVEDEVLKIMEAIEQHDRLIAAAAEERAQGQTRLDAERQRVESTLTGVRQERERLRAERPGLTTGLPPETLAAYDRLVRTRGNAVVSIEQDYCTGCMERLTRQDVFTVQTASRVVMCKSCGRILYAPA